MVDLFLHSIFERSRTKLNFIDFQKFSELISLSVLGLEFVEMIKTPFEQAVGRKSLYFETNNNAKSFYGIFKIK